LFDTGKRFPLSGKLLRQGIADIEA